MKKKIIPPLFAAAILVLVLSACQKQASLKTLIPKLPDVPYTYEGCNGGGFGGCNDNTPSDNPMTDNGATLGRLLFYDPRLSLNNTVSCATCHRQETGFAQSASKSEGYEGMMTGRNSPAIINAFAKSSFFWDGRATSLEEMGLMPGQNHLEMGMEKLDVMEKKLSAVSYYPALFKKAFGTEEITHQEISFALAQFVRSIVSVRSKMDKSQLDAQELAGNQAFIKFNCGRCHAGNNFGGDPLFISYYGTSPVNNSANIGLDVEYADKGIAALTGNPSSNGAFMIPSLRNLAFSAPYMHDGRYKTLAEVIEHYDSGIQPSPALDHVLLDSVAQTPLKMHMTADEKSALAAFLLTLSDESITTDVKFSNPFK